jgi:hypothetical protein
MSIWIATVGALDKSNASQTLRFSDVSFIDNSGNYFENRMLQPALIKVSPDDGGTFKIFSSPSIGEIELINKDGGLNYLMDYALDNGNISLSLVNDDGSQNNYLTGKVESMRFSGDMVYLTVRSMSEVLTRNHVNNKFLGNNALPDGVEGVAGDIKGNIKPRVFGSVLNATPVFVNTSQLIYQFSDRTTATINAIYDKGVALTLHQTYTWADFALFMAHSSIASGKYITCAGYAKLGTTPTGTITGDCSDSVTNAGDVFESILVEESLTLDATSKSALNAIGAVGIYVTSEVSTSALLNQIAQSCGAYWYFMQNVVYAKLIALATTSTLTLTNSELITIDIVNTGIGENGLPVTSVSMQYDKIETAQQETDLAGAVTAARKAVLSQQYRTVFINDSAVQTRHPLAPAIKIDSCLKTSTAATSVATTLLNLSKVRVDTVNITAVVDEIPSLTLGDGVTVFSNKLSYDYGKLLTIIGFQIDAKRKEIILECIG